MGVSSLYVSLYSPTWSCVTRLLARLTMFFTYHSRLLTLVLALASHVRGAPLTSQHTITAADIIKVAPQTRSCTNSPAPDECRTANQAAPYIAVSLTNFGITSFGSQAALLALMLYESGNFKYAINHFPGVPGQGTRNMQSPEYNLRYAQWLAGVCQNCGITQAEVAAAETKGPATLLDLVNNNEWGFGSAAWFLSTQCDHRVQKGLATGSQQGWEQYLSDCVGTPVTDDRTAIWKKIIALKGW